MAKYRKFIIAVTGLVLIGLSTFFDVKLDIGPEGVYEFIVMAAEALGVYAVRNG